CSISRLAPPYYFICSLVPFPMRVRRRQKVLPFAPLALSRTSPFIRFASARASASPRPQPDVGTGDPSPLPRQNGSNTCRRELTGTPGPVSVTDTSQDPVHSDTISIQPLGVKLI